MIKNIGWTLGNDCPCKCRHCYSFSVRQKGQNLTKEIVDRVIEQIEKLNVETVNLGGNEPIFTNGLDVKKSMLPYILKELNKRNIKVGITTAGISLIALKNTYPKCLELLNDVDISFDSPYEKEHNENRGGDVYKYAIQALEICKEYNIESGIIMCAMNWNFTKDRIDALLEIAKKYDSNIRFNLLKPIQLQHFKLVPSKEQVLENYKYLFEKCDTVELSEPTLSGLKQNNKVKGCACGIYSMRINSITPDGKIPVSPCVYMHDYRVGDLLKDDIFDIINSEQFKAIPERTCIGCNEKKQKKELIRIVKDKEGNISIDEIGKSNGRGAYICKNIECLEKAIKSKKLERSLKTKIDLQIYESLRGVMIGK